LTEDNNGNSLRLDQYSVIGFTTNWGEKMTLHKDNSGEEVGVSINANDPSEKETTPVLSQPNRSTTTDGVTRTPNAHLPVITPVFSKEVSEETMNRFKEAQRLMPELIDELKKDVRSDETELVLDVVVTPSPGSVFNFSRECFVYHEAEHPNLKNKINWLVENGFLENRTTGNLPIYRIKAGFAKLLRTTN